MRTLKGDASMACACRGAIVVLIAAAVSWIVPAALFLDPGEAEESCCSSSSLSQSPPSSRLARLSVSLPWS